MATLNANTRAFFFDVFGTCVDWRSSVTNGLNDACSKALKTSANPISPSVRGKAESMGIKGWGDFAQEWRTTYYAFTRGLAKDPKSTWKSVDDHHLDALRDLLGKHGLTNEHDSSGDLWTDDEIRTMSLIWHDLDSWPDTNEGLAILGSHYYTATLSNGNISLLKDMQVHSGMRFTHTYSSELFGSYKPNPAIYNGGARRLGVENSQCVMVAAHLGDLEAAKGCGFQTVYVWRSQEETAEMEETAKKVGFVDIWIKEGEGGFLGVVMTLGLKMDEARKISTSAPPGTTDAV